MTEVLLRVEGLRIWLPSRSGPVVPVDGVDLDVARGEIVGIAGESGSGKSLTSLALLGLLPPGAVTAGRAMFEGRNLLTMSKRQMERVRGVEIGMVFQDPMTSLHPMLTIERQLTEHVRHHLGLGRAAARRRALELLADVRLPDPKAALSSYPHQFSGGMRQRLAISIALACEPKLLIADEPTTALDVTVQAGILHLVKRLCRDHDMAAIVITHDLGVMSVVAERLSVFYAGRVAEAGTVAQLIGEPRHPYTAGLLDALPKADRSGGELVTIGGAPPSPANRPGGCPFHPRCRFALDSCRTEVPPLEELDDGRRSACPVDPLVKVL